MHEVLVNRLGGLSLPRISVVRLTDRPDMTLDVYRGRKTTKQQQLFSGNEIKSLFCPPFFANDLYERYARYSNEQFFSKTGGLSTALIENNRNIYFNYMYFLSKLTKKKKNNRKHNWQKYRLGTFCNRLLGLKLVFWIRSLALCFLSGSIQC